MAHTCAALVITCIDFHLIHKIEDYLKSLGLEGNHDLLTEAGAAKGVPTPFVQEQIDISVNLHKIKQVFIINHEDCGAYGGKEKFASDQEEKEFHTSEMAKAEKIISEKHPRLEIIKLYAYLDGRFERV